MSEAYKPGSCECPRESACIGMAAADKFHFVRTAGEIGWKNGRIHYWIDLMSPTMSYGDGPCAEEAVNREIRKAVSLHAVPAAPSVDLTRGPEAG